VLTPTGTLIPNSVGNTGGLFAGLPRMARAALMGKGSTNVTFASCVVNRENLEDLAMLLRSGDVKVVIDNVYPLGEAPRAVAPHARTPRQRQGLHLRVAASRRMRNR
jgi:NADPH:quinone reductase-like Zn-dependent oxidoreductase